MTKIKDFFRHCFFPTRCLLCGILIEFDSLLCETCEKMAEFVNNETNERDLYTLFWYNENTQRMIYRYKFSGVGYMGRQMARLAYEQSILPPAIARDTIFVPVPLHQNRLKERGFNQAYIIARELSRLYNQPVADLLLRNKETKSQRELSIHERQKNVSNAFILAPTAIKYDQTTITLVDDVWTTGATMEACAKVICEAGEAFPGKKVIFLTILQTKKQSP